MGPTATELDVECPACGAIPGEPCHGKVKRSHLRRRSAEVWAVLSKDLPPRRERQLWLSARELDAAVSRVQRQRAAR